MASGAYYGFKENAASPRPNASLLSPSSYACTGERIARNAIEDWKLNIISFTHSDAPTSLTASAQSMTFGWRLVGYADIIFKSFILSIFKSFLLLCRWPSVEDWTLKIKYYHKVQKLLRGKMASAGASLLNIEYWTLNRRSLTEWTQSTQSVRPNKREK